MNKVNEVTAALDGNKIYNIQVEVEQKFGKVVKVVIDGKDMEVADGSVKPYDDNSWEICDLGSGYQIEVKQNSY